MTRRYRLAESARLEGNLLIVEGSEDAYELSEEGAVVLSLIEGAWMTPMEIATLLSEEWEMEDPSDAVRDIRDFLDSLVREGVVIVDGKEGNDPR